MSSKDYDAVVVGSGPNGLAAAITLQQEGLSVLLLEAKEETGGGLRSKALTLPGYLHDVCSAIHPMAAASPFSGRFPSALTGWNSSSRPYPQHTLLKMAASPCFIAPCRKQRPAWEWMQPPTGGW